MAIADGRYLDLVTIGNPAKVPPVSGTATYQLDDYMIQTSGAIADAALDMSMAVVFGAMPRLAAEGTLTLDSNYAFSTPGGLAGVATGGRILTAANFSLVAPMTEGTGDYCTDIASCSVSIMGAFHEDMDRAGGNFLTFGGVRQAAGIFTMKSDDLTGLSFDADAGVASGNLTNAFAHDGQLPLFVNGGGSNIVAGGRNNLAMFDAVYDDRGLVSLTYDESNPSRTGDLLFARGEGMAVADLAGDADWQLGRYTGGRLEGQNAIYGANNGAHYAVIAPLTNAPGNGTIGYTLKAATRPVYSDEATEPGSFTGAMAVRFAAIPTVGLEGTVTMPDATYSFQTTGGAADPARSALRLFPHTLGESGLTFSAELPATFSADTSVCRTGISCQVGIGGQIGGDGAGWANMGYVIRGTSSNTETPKVSGVAVFEGGEFVPEAPPLTGTQVTN